MNLRIAIPTSAGRLHGHFGDTKEFTLVDTDRQSNTVVNMRVIAAPPHHPGLFPRWLREQDVHVVLTGGIGQRALTNFNQHGIAVHAGEVNSCVETLVASYLAGLLTDSPKGCKHHEHQHEYDDNHHHEQLSSGV